jgi:hypothetical protein
VVLIALGLTLTGDLGLAARCLSGYEHPAVWIRTADRRNIVRCDRFTGPSRSSSVYSSVLKVVFVSEQFVFSRVHLKWVLLSFLIILAASTILQTEWTFARDIKDALYFLESGLAVSAVAICIALVATV